MAEKKSSGPSFWDNNRKKLNLTGLQKAWIGGALLFFVINVILMCIFGLNSLLFSGNERFTLREIVIAPPDGYMYTYWNSEHYRDERIEKICRDLQLVPGTTNLFDLDLREMRNTMLQKNPEIQSIEIRKKYPDQLEFMIRERTPLLKLSDKTCLDEQFKVVSIDRYKNIDLPLFVDYDDEKLQNITLGEDYRTKQVEYAQDLVKFLQEKYPQIHLVRIAYEDTPDKKHMDCVFRYENNNFNVLLPYPVTLENLHKHKIKHLYDLLQLHHNKKKYDQIIDLTSNENMAVAVPSAAPIKK